MWHRPIVGEYHLNDPAFWYRYRHVPVCIAIKVKPCSRISIRRVYFGLHGFDPSPRTSTTVESLSPTIFHGCFRAPCGITLNSPFVKLVASGTSSAYVSNKIHEKAALHCGPIRCEIDGTDHSPGLHPWFASLLDMIEEVIV